MCGSALSGCDSKTKEEQILKFTVMSLPRLAALPTNPEVPRLNQSWPEFPRSFVLDESGFCVSSEPSLVQDPKLLQLA